MRLRGAFLVAGLLLPSYAYALPDLAIQEVQVNRTAARSTDVTVRMVNQGDQPVRGYFVLSSLPLYPRPGRESRVTILIGSSGLAAGGIQTRNLTLAVSASRWQFTVDVTNGVRESNESNNTYLLEINRPPVFEGTGPRCRWDREQLSCGGVPRPGREMG